MNDYKKIIASLRSCGNDDGIVECEWCFEQHTAGCGCSNALMRKAANAIEELLSAAKKMHTWIFLNTGDEQAAYDECGLSDAMNAALGYAGQFVVEEKEDAKD